MDAYIYDVVEPNILFSSSLFAFPVLPTFRAVLQNPDRIPPDHKSAPSPPISPLTWIYNPLRTPLFLCLRTRPPFQALAHKTATSFTSITVSSR
ncbi:hypothetical protein FA13DRAFT_825106 [Coprinellus micaceus]|uniref:Uncharacterized protein n=1 Tax=Coprinellus micaceus TaxID=71717 RepID=A0A4Y7S395_COPMI|nr:hypothetical protein FA13DRAFT_825106 [Coprinellus micaceus]